MSTDFEGTGTELDLASLGSVQKYSDKEFDQVATASKFLPRLQLFTFQSDEVKADKIKAGRFGFVTMKGQPIIDLTESVDLLVVCWRPKALDMSTETIVSVFDINDPAFTDIASRSDDTDSGCMFGPEFLIWIPGIEKFAAFFCGSKTARRESVNIKSLIKDGPKPVTLKSTLIQKGRYSWHGPRSFECNTPFGLPAREELIAQINEFNNPPAKEQEAAPEPTGGRVR